MPIIKKIVTALLLSSCGSLPAAAQFLFPKENQSFNSNIIIAIRVADSSGTSRLELTSATSNFSQTLCDNNCGVSFSRTLTGINPLNLGLPVGSNTLQLIATDNNGATSQLDSVNFNWQPQQISGVQVARQPGTLTVNWQPVTGAFRYNLYIASEENITPANISGKADNQIFRAINATSQQVTGFADQQGLFALVTAIDASGESTFSEELRIPAFNNLPPIAADDNFSVDEDILLQGNVLQNDSDPEQSELTTKVVTSTQNGTLSLQENGSFNYQPNNNFNGTDQFSYELIDSANGVAQGTVSIEVNPVNDAPFANDDEYNLQEDSQLSISVTNGLIANDTDIDDPITSLSIQLTAPTSSGQIDLNSDGSFTYTPQQNFFGQDSFTYQLTDTSGGSSSATVTLNINNVNDPPLANNDSYQTQEDQPLQVDGSSHPSLLANDIDADITADNSQELTVNLVSNTSNGQLSLSTDGTFSYIPAPEFSGEDGFTYSITDSAGLTSQANVNISVTNINDPPGTSDDNYELNEDTVLTIASAQGVLSNDTDPDSAPPLTAVLNSTPVMGSVSLNSDGSFTYTPNLNAFGQDSFSYLAIDAEGASSPGNVNVSILPINDAPIANNDQTTTGLNQATNIDVLANDTDPDKDTLSITAVSTNNGTATTDGKSINFNPANNFFGTANIDYTITDAGQLTASAQVTVNVAIGIPLVANDDSLITDEDTPASVNVLANDTGSGVVRVVSATASRGVVSINGGLLTYTPASNINGNDTINYSITDLSNDNASAQVNVSINSIPDSPIANNDTITTALGTSITIPVLDNDSDGDDDTLTITSATTDNGTVVIQGQQLLYTPASGFSGQVTINYSISDGNDGTASAIVTVTVSSSQLIANNDSAVTLEDTSVNIDVLANDSGGAGLAVSDVAVSQGSVDIESNGTLTYTPPANFSGFTSFNYFTSDNSGQSASASVIISVTPVNDAPVSVADSYLLTSAANIVIPASAGVLGNDSDPESNPMTASIVTAPSHSSAFTLNADGSFNYQHDGSSNTSDSFTYRASDTLNGNVVTATLNIAKVNLPAKLCNVPPLTAQSGQAFSFNLEAVNPDGDNLSFSASGLPSWLSLSGNTLSGTPTDSHIGVTNNIQLNVSDGVDQESLSNIQLTVIDDFASSNIKDFNFGSISGNSRINDMTLDRNGNIIAVGSVNDSGETIAIARFKPNGVLDTSFSGDGLYTLDLDYSFDEQATAVVVDKNNNIYVSAYGSEDSSNVDNDFYLLKLKPDGTADTSFSSDGRASFEILTNKVDQAMDLVLHSDGDITLIGHTQVAAGNSDIALVHVNPDGTIDSSFGSSGKLVFTVPNNQFAYTGLLDYKGHIYVAGSHNNGTDDDVLLLRTKETGLDSAFNNNTGGAYHLPVSNTQMATDIIFDAKGNLLVSGTSNGDFAIYSFALNASQVPFLNTAAFSGGQKIQDLGDVDTAYKILADKQGKFYAIGITGTSTPKTAVIKLNADGSLDTSYASSGIFTEATANGNSGDKAAAILSASGQLITSGPQGSDTRLRLQQINSNSIFSCNITSVTSGSTKTLDTIKSAIRANNGHIYLAGESTNPADSQKDFLLAKLEAEGEPDISFANTGILRQDSGSTSESLTLTHVLADSNASPFLIGHAGTDKLYIAKYTSTGSLDTSFSDNGINDFGSGDQRLVPRAALIDNSNNVYLAGIQSSKSTLMKITPSGGLDLGFASGMSQVEFSDSNFNVLDMAILSDGSIYLVGENTSNSRLALVKYTSTGALDSSFGTGGYKELNTDFASKGIAVATNGTYLYVLTQRNVDDVEIRKLNSSGNEVNSFGSSGVMDLSGYKSHAQADIQYITASGQLLVQVKNSSAQNILLNLNANGSFNTSFINAGAATYTHNLANWEEINGFIQTSSGELLIYGRENDDMAISKMQSNGRISNLQSELLIDGGFGHAAYAIALDRASRILVAGTAYNTSNNTQDFAYARFAINGSTDTSLTGSSAVQITADAGAQHESYRDILVTPGSQIQVSGQAFSAGSPEDHNIKGLRTQSDSVAADNSYAGGGFDFDLASVSNDKVNAQLLLSDGALFMAGSLNNQGLIVKLNTLGVLDTSFGAGGIQQLSLGDSSVLNALTVDAEGKLIAVGETNSSGNVSAFMLRMDINSGTLDSSFDSDGIAILNLSSLDTFTDVTITSEGKYVAVGSSNQQTLIAQFEKNGSHNTSFNSTGYITNDLGENDTASAVVIDNYGAILVASQTSSSNILLRYNNSGSQLLLAEHFSSGILNHSQDLIMDHHGNAYITGKMQIDGLWKFFVIKFNAVASPL